MKLILFLLIYTYSTAFATTNNSNVNASATTSENITVPPDRQDNNQQHTKTTDNKQPRASTTDDKQPHVDSIVYHPEIETPETRQIIVIKDSDQNRPWWIGDLLTVVSILIGAWLIIFQIKKQYANTITAQQDNTRDQLRLDVYEEFSKCLTKANHETLEVAGYARMIPFAFQNILHQTSMGISVQPVKQRANVFSDLHSASFNSIIDLIYLIEKYVIVSPELGIFKIAFNAAHHDVQNHFNPLFQYLLKVLPMDMIDAHGNHHIMNTVKLTEEHINELQILVDSYIGANSILGSYLFDLNVELQKIFLNKLFNNPVQVRDPIDPNYKVIQTDNESIAKLNKYFEEETEWGEHKRTIEDEVSQSIRGRDMPDNTDTN